MKTFATAVAISGAATAYALDEKRKRKEEEAKQLAEAQAKATKLNAAEEQRKAVAARLESQAILNAQQAPTQNASYQAHMEAKMERMEAEDESKWIASQAANQKKINEKKKEDKARDADSARWAGLASQGQYAANVPQKNWLEKTKEKWNSLVDKWTSPADPSGPLFGRPGWMDSLPPLSRLPLEVYYSTLGFQYPQTNYLNSKIGNLIGNVFSYTPGISYQLIDDLSLGLFGWSTGMQLENGNEFFQDGRRVGRIITTVAGQIELAIGGALALSGISFIPPTLGGTAGCAAVTGLGAVACIGVGGGALVVEGAAVVGGTVIAGHGASVLARISKNPLQIRGSGSGGNLPPNPELGYFGTNAQDTSKNADRLFDNMKIKNPGIEKPDGYAAHHIIPAGSKRPDAVEARILLEKFGIDINNTANGVIIPKNINSHLNSIRYEEAVLEMLQDARNDGATRDEVIFMLQEIGEQILENGTYP